MPFEKSIISSKYLYHTTFFDRLIASFSVVLMCLGTLLQQKKFFFYNSVSRQEGNVPIKVK